VALVGIAGSYYKDALPPGSAACFDSVTLDGVGAGQGDAFKSAASMGFDHGVKEDVLPLCCPTGLRHGEQLLTVCAASGSNVHALMRRDRYPQAAAEDMEGFAVALACRQAGVELTILRGISNLAGQRDLKQWVIDDAMATVSKLLTQWLTT
jgi:futalosine hydrolase